VSSVQSDAARLQGTLHVTSGTGYAVHEIQTPTGTTVREYMSASGKVFAVAWKGPWPPDLQQLLGTYFSQFQQAAQSAKQRAGRTPLAIHQSNLVVERSGHMRSWMGRAYLSNQLPSGMSVESIR